MMGIVAVVALIATLRLLWMGEFRPISFHDCGAAGDWPVIEPRTCPRCGPDYKTWSTWIARERFFGGYVTRDGRIINPGKR